MGGGPADDLVQFLSTKGIKTPQNRVMLEGPRGVAGTPSQDPQVVVGLGAVRGDFEGGQVRRLRPVPMAEVVLGAAQTAVRLRIVRVQPYRLIERTQAFPVPSEFGVQMPEIKVRLEVLRVTGERTLSALEGRGEITLVLVDHGQGEMGFDGVGVDVYGAGEHGDTSFRMSGVDMGPCEVPVQPHEIRTLDEGVLQRFDRQGGTIGFKQQQPQAVVSGPVEAIEMQRVAKMPFSGFAAPQEPIAHAQMEMARSRVITQAMGSFVT